MTDRVSGDAEQALLKHAERQTKALEHIVNLLWFWLALALAGVVFLIATVNW